MPSFLGNSFNGPATKRLAEGCASDIIPTTATGGQAANSLLACEILAFLLQ
ncbi:MAG: hypothetical protein KUA35_07740 [Pseudodesulfovibrio sp.]|uniref:hypothetical protein n=1 Tax=Pseudodesulfovibrio TaxID=2035811 RepID=UPI00031C39B4|nr:MULTISPECIES: hypothetical protein [Pseudodesulfovibrio]MBU4190983.1 hypothetical protein [Pseudomonadota bacterium]MBU4377868.1 hypothetical protein [Pseudomonadota bacterium]MBU4476318.1 hypothetical protein [Pseudomonadota bacterium]MBU4516041.1 hypothetical protein [Pseudomonadota bacterium]MBU4522757.1 hypothetical protein [Pseudomonadota bacterium]